MIGPEHCVAMARDLEAKGDFPAALQALMQALQASPGDRSVLLALSRLSTRLGARDDALALFDMALGSGSADDALILERAALLEQAGRPGEALEVLSALARSRSDDALPALRLGYLLRRLQRHEDSAEICRAAAAGHPSSAEAWVSFGISHHNHGRLDAAERCFRRALTIAPEEPLAHFSLGSTLLAGGRWREGFAGFVRRRQLHDGIPAPGGLPDADRDRRDQRLLLWNDQGLGDALQFLRYVPLLLARGHQAVLLLAPPLARIARTLPGAPAILTPGEPLPALDAQLSLLDIPHFLDAEDIPATVPYLRPERQEAERWAERLRHLPGLKVGLVWAGAPCRGDFQYDSIDSRRSVRLTDLAPLLAVEGASFVSLQKGEAARQIADLPPALRPFDAMSEIGDFAGTAALAAALDLVISVDTSVAHLAGAIGKPVWIVSRFDGCWRWQKGRDDSPWYPTARLFRQTEPGDWGDPIGRVSCALGELAAARI